VVISNSKVSELVAHAISFPDKQGQGEPRRGLGGGA